MPSSQRRTWRCHSDREPPTHLHFRPVFWQIQPNFGCKRGPAPAKEPRAEAWLVRAGQSCDRQTAIVDLALGIFADVLATDATHPADCIICQLRRQMEQALDHRVHDDEENEDVPNNGEKSSNGIALSGGNRWQVHLHDNRAQQDHQCEGSRSAFSHHRYLQMEAHSPRKFFRTVS